MKLINKVLIPVISIFTILSSQSVIAESTESASSDQAKIVFVRGEETPKTRALKFNVYLGDESVGRMKVNQTKTMVVAPGEYKVWSNFYKGEPMIVTVNAGETTYIQSSMIRKSNRISSNFEVVSDQVALEESSLNAANTDS